MKYDTDKYIATIKEAIAAADMADPGVDNDGGACNFDCAYLQVPGMRQAQFETIAAAFPKHALSLNDYRWHGRIIQLLHSNGQANRRTVMAEAAGKVFKASGLPNSMYYQMD